MKTAGGNEPSVEVMVAANDIQVGSKLEDKAAAGEIRFGLGSARRLPERTETARTWCRATDCARGIHFAVQAGWRKRGFRPARIDSSGMRAVSVRVNEVVAVAGFATPGTRVDVLLTGNPIGGAEKQTTTVLENVAVLASGKSMERNSAGEAQTAPVITLLVSPDDAQKLTLASSEGRIQLALRNPLDTRDQSLNSTKEFALYRGATPPVAPKMTHVTKKVPVAVALPPSPFSVEIIKGDKRETTTLDKDSQ